MTAMENAVMNWDRLERFTDGDIGETEELVALFLDQSEDIVTSLKTAQATSQTTEWKMAAHKLKGSAANMGAERMAKISAEAESVWEQDSHVKGRYVDDILVEQAELRRILDKLTAAKGSAKSLHEALLD